IARDLKLPLDAGDWWQEHAEETFNQRLLRFFRESVAEGVGGPVVIFLDEIDSTLKLDFTDDLFTAIRGMYNERTLVPAYERIIFCLLGVATPNELIKDRRTTPYNVGRTLELDDFDPAEEDLTPIIRALSDDPDVGARLLDRVLYWTGGHPYLTVKLCVELARAGANTEAEVDSYVDATYGRLERISADVHFQQILRFVAKRLSDSLATFDLYERILNGKRERDQTTLTHAELKLSGLVKRDADGCLVVRNRIYKRLFDLRWVASSKPRQVLARTRRWALAASFLLVILIVGMVAFFWWASVHDYPPGIAAKGLLVRVGLLSPIEPELRTLPAGSFQMGSSECASVGPDFKRYTGCPQHLVKISAFSIGKYEVTFAEYDRFAVATGRRLPGDSGWGRGARPVI
ncbi:MAG: formylglycine-generating enzyme family protein, partial [Caldilineaceae bacterium]